MFEIGTVCVKTAGRDAGKTCVVIEAPKDNLVVVEGETRRRKCNVLHLEPTGKSVDVKAGASHAAVMKELGLKEKEQKSRKPTTKPTSHTTRVKKTDVAAAKPVKKKAKA